MAKGSKHEDVYEEGTDKYERTHVDPTALNHVFDIVKRFQKGKGSVGPQCDWFDKACPSYRVQLSYNPAQVDADKGACERAVQTRNVLKTAADTLYKIWEHISLQLETCEHNIEAYELRRGFFTLPDEILSTVLEYAALQGPLGEEDVINGKKDDEKENIIYTVKSAAKLSHVCKRLRDLIIHSPRLWKCVFNGMGEPNMVSTCLSRCKRGNGEAALKRTKKIGGVLFIEVAENVIPVSKSLRKVDFKTTPL